MFCAYDVFYSFTNIQSPTPFHPLSVYKLATIAWNLLVVPLVANGVTILFDSMNSEFFPFQTDLLDVNLYLPQHGLDRSMFCVDSKYPLRFD